jgi:hypothetical protein
MQVGSLRSGWGYQNSERGGIIYGRAKEFLIRLKTH